MKDWESNKQDRVLEGSFSSLVDDLRKLPDVTLNVAKKIWYQVGAAHLARTKVNTPVGNYSNEVEFYTRDGKYVHFFVKKVPIGGQLRLRWSQSPVQIVRQRTLRTVVYNNVEYAPYVEYGHRIRDKSGATIGYVPGRYMMTSSLKVSEAQDIPNAMNKIVEEVKKVW